jgi:hypothetical protein
MMRHFNEDMFNASPFNESASLEIVLGGIDPGVSFTISDELGGFEEAISDECMC